MRCLQSPHKFTVTAPLHHHKHQGSALCLKNEAWTKFKNKTKGTNDDRNTCHAKKSQTTKGKIPAQNTSWHGIKRDIVWKNFLMLQIYSLWMGVRNINNL